MASALVALFILVLTLFLNISCAKYEPNWNSLDTRPIPSWYDKAKIGIFIHWGVFSVPSFGSEWFWIDWKSGGKEYEQFMKNNYPPNFSYPEYAKEFTAEFFNATEWAELFAKSGAKYVVLTSKHHEGFTMWPSEYSFSWNSKDIGPHRDIVGELGTAVRKANLKFGLYHSLYEWYNPMYLADKKSNFARKEFVVNKLEPEMRELINNYQPSVLWSDGDWEANDTYWDSTEFLAWLYNDSPVRDEIVANDRWGSGIPCKHGDFYTCSDRYDPGVLIKHKWENAMTIDKKSWGFRRNAKLSDYLTISELLGLVARTVSCGGNILINIGPSKEGIVNPIFEERLAQLGQWLSINGEAIYESHPWTAQNDTLDGNVWYTKKSAAIYAISLKWPKENVLVIESVKGLFKNADTDVTLLGNEGKLKWLLDTDRVQIRFPDKATVKSENAWVLKITVHTR